MYIIVFSISILVFYYWKKPKVIYKIVGLLVRYFGGKPEFIDKVVYDFPDFNYCNLEKMVLSVNINNNNAKVFGLVLFESSSENHKEIFATYITGFSGYYRKGIGGNINGKAYGANNDNATKDLLKLCDEKHLIGNRSNLSQYNSSIKLVIDSSRYLQYAEQKNSWGSNSLVFCFLTPNGLYIKTLSKNELGMSPMASLYNKIQILKLKF